ncbi:MAG: L-arabinose ABC transporter permease AraH [Phycisphaerales bacterium]|nr:L-arabinose ABC transporter permease AraH [Phycisphaerales bacterium]
MTSRPPRSAAPSALALLWEQAGMLAVLGILFLACSLLVPNFFTIQNMQGLVLAVSTVGMVSCTMLFCLASGNFDLSVGSVVAAAGVIAAAVMHSSGSVTIGVAAALASGTAVGLLNGVVVAKARINPLITTLATMQIVRGAAYIASDGKALGIGQESFFLLGNSAFLRIPTPVWICIACFVTFGFLLARTVFGRNTLAIGGNEEAARLAGVPVDRTKIGIFALQGLIAALAGVVLASRMTSGQPMTSQGFELEVISACVLGGVSLTGGVGRIEFVIAGVLIMGIVQNAMNLQNIQPFYQYVARGAILLGAVLFDRYRRRQ